MSVKFEFDLGLDEVERIHPKGKAAVDSVFAITSTLFDVVGKTVAATAAAIDTLDLELKDIALPAPILGAKVATRVFEKRHALAGVGEAFGEDIVGTVKSGGEKIKELLFTEGGGAKAEDTAGTGSGGCGCSCECPEGKAAAGSALTQALDSQASPTEAISPLMDNSALEASIEERLNLLRDMGKTELELLAEKHEEELKLLEEKRQSELDFLVEQREEQKITEDEFNELNQESEDRLTSGKLKTKQDYTAAADNLDKTSWNNQKANVVGALGTISGLMQSGNKKLFEIGKAAAIANATISMYEGVQKAWAIGGPFGAPLAALVLVAGLANIASIKKTQFGGGGGGGGAAGGGGSMAIPNGAATQAIPPPPPGFSKDADRKSSGGSVQVIINGAITPDMIDKEVIPRIRDGIDNRDLVIVSSNSRQAQELRIA